MQVRLGAVYWELRALALSDYRPDLKELLAVLRERAKAAA